MRTYTLFANDLTSVVCGVQGQERLVWFYTEYILAISAGIELRRYFAASGIVTVGAIDVLGVVASETL